MISIRCPSFRCGKKIFIDLHRLIEWTSFFFLEMKNGPEMVSWAVSGFHGFPVLSIEENSPLGEASDWLPRNPLLLMAIGAMATTSTKYHPFMPHWIWIIWIFRYRFILKKKIYFFSHDLKESMNHWEPLPVAAVPSPRAMARFWRQMELVYLNTIQCYKLGPGHEKSIINVTKVKL